MLEGIYTSQIKTLQFIQVLVKLAGEQLVIILQVAKIQRKRETRLIIWNSKQFILQSSCAEGISQVRNTSRFKSDNTIAIAYFNNMGGSVSEKCSDVAKHLAISFFLFKKTYGYQLLIFLEFRTLQHIICLDLSMMIQSGIGTSDI